MEVIINYKLFFTFMILSFLLFTIYNSNHNVIYVKKK